MFEYNVTFIDDTGKKFLVTVIDEEGMNEDEIVTEAQVNMQREGIQFDTEKLELVSCTLKGEQN